MSNAERVVATMGNLKGAAMKVGQGIAQAVEADLPLRWHRPSVS